MGNQRVRTLTFARGLETTSSGRSDDPFAWEEFLNFRSTRGSARRRDGMVRIASFSNASTAIDFNGATDSVVMPNFGNGAGEIDLPLTWTMETLFQAGTLASQQTLFGDLTGSQGPIRLYVTTAGVLTWVVYDSSNTGTTLTIPGITANQVVGVQMIRDGADLSIFAAGLTDTDTMSATNALKDAGWNAGTQNSTNYLTGRIDFFRIFSGVKAHKMDLYCRLLNPRARDVIANWDFVADANGYVVDSSVNQRHLATTGSVAAGASISVRHTPIWGLAQTTNTSGARDGYARAAGYIYPFTLA